MRQRASLADAELLLAYYGEHVGVQSRA